MFGSAFPRLGALLVSITLFSPAFAQGVDVGGGWKFIRNVDKMTDENTSFIVKSSGDGSLALKCMGTGGYKPLWLFNSYVTSRASFMYRFDKEAAKSVDSDQIASSNKALFLDDEVGFVDKMKIAKTLTLQVRDRDGEVITQQFELSGVSSALSYANKNAPCR